MGSIGVNERTVMGMDEYIRKESAISIFRAKAEMAVCTPAQPYFDCAAKMLELLPAADVAPVRHGRWIDRIDTETPMHECSVCGARVVKGLYEYENPNRYCYHCGARMDLEEEHDQRRSNSDS